MRYKLLSILIFCPFMVLSMQIDDPGLPGDDPDLPIDGGVTVLLIAGAIYGLKKINQQRED